MIAKLKLLLNKVTLSILAVLGTLAYIFLLRKENKQLKDSMATELVKDELGKVLDEKTKATEIANRAQHDYESARDEYLRSRLSGSNSKGGSGFKEEG